MTASRHRRLTRTGGHPPPRAPASKCAPCYTSPAPRRERALLPRAADADGMLRKSEFLHARIDELVN